jgi:chemotaxis protein histidine kinase CheA
MENIFKNNLATFWRDKDLSYVFPFEDFQELWDSNPFIIFDTNGFLNIYRYSTETIDQILRVLSSIPKEQIMVPAQVLEEFLKNRENVISTEYSKYKEVTKEVDRIMLTAKNDIEKQFTKYNKFRFPLVKELGLKIDEAIQSITKEAQTYKEKKKLKEMRRC